MTVDYAAVPQLFLAAVPFAKFLGTEFVDVGPGTATLRLRDDPAKHNHIGTLHAGAIFSLAESASGAAMISAFAHRLADVTPLAARAEVTYARVARGDVTAVARVEGAPEELLATLDEVGKVRFPVVVDVRDESGEIACTVTVDWHLRKAKSGT